RFEPPEAAHAALTALSTAWRSPQLDTSQGIDHTRSAGQGRPTSTRPLKALAWQMPAQVRPAQEVIEAHQQQRWSWAPILQPATWAMRRSSEPIKPHLVSRAGADGSKTHGALCRRWL